MEVFMISLSELQKRVPEISLRKKSEKEKEIIILFEHRGISYCVYWDKAQADNADLLVELIRKSIRDLLKAQAED